MKKLLVGTLIFTAAAVFASPLHKSVDRHAAQSPVSSSQRVEATIPFEFQVGKVVLPAGTYAFTFDTVNQVGWIKGVEGQSKIFSLANYVTSGTEPKVEFKRDGNVMVLQQVPSRGRNRRTGVAELQGQGYAPGR